MTAEMLSMIDEQIYIFLEKYVNIMPIRFVKIIAYYYTDARIRKIYLERLGVQIGENTFTNLGFIIVTFEKGLIIIGNNVSIAPGVTLIADSSPNNGNEIKQIDYISNKLCKKEKIVIEDEVWIGANVTILPGVTVGRCSIIGAGSVVTTDVEPYSIYAGVPAKKIRDLK